MRARGFTAALIRRRRAVFVLGGLLVVILGSLNLAFPSPFAPTNLVIGGTEAARWDTMQYAAGFGTNVNVLLKGPPSQLERQGQALVARLRRQSDIHVLSPFDPGESQRALRPTPDSTILIIDVQQKKSAAIYSAVAPVRNAVDATIAAPLSADIAGQAATADGLNSVAYKATHDAELIAVPVLVLVLLFVFGSPIAAAIPGLVGLATVLAGSGVVAAIAATVQVDPVAVSLESMMGLALGVDYSLLLVSRFRELRRQAREQGEGDTDHELLLRAMSATAGRTVLFAAALLVTEMTAAALLSPGDVLYSVALAVIVVTLIAAAISVCITPCLLFALAPYLDRWQLREIGVQGGASARIIARALRHRAVIPVLALLGLLALAAPTTALRTGAPDVRELPPGTPARSAYVDFAKTLGAGFAATMEVVLRSEHGPITTTRRLEALAGLQGRLSGDRDVGFVIGPAPLAALAKQLGGLESARSGAKGVQSLKGLALGMARTERKLEALQATRALGAAAAQIGLLRAELTAMAEAMRRYSATVEHDEKSARQAESLSPGYARSGYLALAGIEGASQAKRQQAAFVVNTQGGGQYARFVIVPKYGPNDPRVAALFHRVAGEVREFARAEGLEGAAGGPAGILTEYTEVTSRRLPILVVCLVAISFFVLVVILRAIVLPAICVVLNALTAGVAFGVMSIGFQGTHPALGGPGYVDIVSLLGTFTVVFALSIDYQVFLLSRMREEMLRSGDHATAVSYGLGATASVVTGAAAIMVGVFLAFALSSYIAIREVGVGLAVAVFLDATVVRLILLPTVMMIIGEKCWWLPERVGRLVPALDM